MRLHTPARTPADIVALPWYCPVAPNANLVNHCKIALCHNIALLIEVGRTRGKLLQKVLVVRTSQSAHEY